MRKIEHLVVHCSATKVDQQVDAAEIRKWHLDRGFTDIGYHFIISRNGVVVTGRPVEAVGAHVAGYNSKSIGICLIGGLDAKNKAENNFTVEQFESLESLLKQMRKDYPQASILGHRDFPGVAKDCPCFDVRAWCVTNGINPRVSA